MEPLKYATVHLEYVIVKMVIKVTNVMNVMQVIIILVLMKHLYVQVNGNK